MKDIILVYITCPTHEKAYEIAQCLLERELVACANMHAIESMYRWEGGTQSDQEVVLLCKTREYLLPIVEQVVKSIHTYSIPCILAQPVYANPEFAHYVSQHVQQKPD